MEQMMRSITTVEQKFQPVKVNQNNEKDFSKIYEEADETCVVFL